MPGPSCGAYKVEPKVEPLATPSITESAPKGIKREHSGTESQPEAKQAKKMPRAKALQGEDEPEFDESLVILDWCK